MKRYGNRQNSSRVFCLLQWRGDVEIPAIIDVQSLYRHQLLRKMNKPPSNSDIISSFPLYFPGYILHYHPKSASRIINRPSAISLKTLHSIQLSAPSPIVSHCQQGNESVLPHLPAFRGDPSGTLAGRLFPSLH
jgi:hypothetical protein